MNKQQRTEDALRRANGVISSLVNALDAVKRADSLAYAQGAAEHAIAIADSKRELNADGYLEVR
jgi:hypothetical protein